MIGSSILQICKLQRQACGSVEWHAVGQLGWSVILLQNCSACCSLDKLTKLMFVQVNNKASMLCIQELEHLDADCKSSCCLGTKASGCIEAPIMTPNGVRKERKEKFTLFSNHTGSLLRRQPGAHSIVTCMCFLAG